MSMLRIVLVVAALLQSQPWRGSPGRAMPAPPRQPGRPPRISIEPHHPVTVIPLSGALSGPVAIDAQDNVVFLTDDGVLGKLARDGRFHWSLLLAPSTGAPSLDPSGTAYVAGLDGRLYAVDPDGSLTWSRPLWGRPVGGVTIGSSSLAVALDSGVVRFWDPRLRRIVAQVDIAAHPSAAPSLRSDGGMVVPTKEGWLVGLDQQGVRWRTRVATSALGPAAISATGLAFVGARGGILSAVDARGTLVWFRPLGGPIERSPVLGAAGNIYVLAAEQLLAVGPDGALRWRRSLPGRAVAGPLVADDGSIFVAVARPAPPHQVLLFGKDGEVTGQVPLRSAPATGIALQRNQLWVSLSGGSLQRAPVSQEGLANSGWAKPRGGAMNSGTTHK